MHYLDLLVRHQEWLFEINTIANFSTFIGFIKDVKLVLVFYMGVISGVSSVVDVMILNAYGTHVWYQMQNVVYNYM